jgi:hypothetical protein
MTDEPPEDAEFRRWLAEHDPFGTGESARTDESLGGAEFTHWFEEKDPFGNREGSFEHEIVKARMMRRLSSIMWFGAVLPYMLAMVGTLALCFLIGWALHTFW